MNGKWNYRPLFAGRDLKWLIFLIGATLCLGAIGQLGEAGIRKNAEVTSANAPNQEEIPPSIALADLRGLWVRVGDDFQGLVMKIDGPEKQLEGRLVYVSSYAQQWGFRVDDIKVKEFSRTGGDRLSVKSLQRQSAEEGFRQSYSEFVVYTRGTDELLMRQAKGQNVEVGAWQRWVRTDASKEKYWVAISERPLRRNGAAGLATGVAAEDSLETNLEAVRAKVERLEKEGKTNENYALQDFVGVWSRADDDLEGMTMEIQVESSNSLSGRLLVTPSKAESYGFRPGDIKIRNLTRVGPDEYTVESLAKNNQWDQGTYAKDFVYMRGKNELLFVQAKGEYMLIGAWQSWVRQDEADLQYDTYWLNKGLLAERERRWQEATTFYKKALKLSPENPLLLNNVAWRLATNPKAHQEPKLAVEYAETACKKTDFAEANYVDTLAAAYAALGDFEKAREYQARACELAKPASKDFLERKALYEQNRAFAETDGN